MTPIPETHRAQVDKMTTPQGYPKPHPTRPGWILSGEPFTMLDEDGCPVSCPSCPHRHDLYVVFAERGEQVRAMLGRIERLERQVRDLGQKPVA